MHWSHINNNVTLQIQKLIYYILCLDLAELGCGPASQGLEILADLNGCSEQVLLNNIPEQMRYEKPQRDGGEMK